MQNFEELNWEIMVESRQYRAGGAKKLNLRQVANFAFLDLLALYILHNEYEMSAVAGAYSQNTMSFRNFQRPRLSGTDLYTSLNILSNPNSVFSKTIKQNPDIDTILRNKINVHLPTVKRYLELLEKGNITGSDAAQLLLRLEKQLFITDSQYKSMRRLVQDWPNLTSMQRELVVTRMSQQYRKFARRSELFVFLEDLSKLKGYKMDATAVSQTAQVLAPGGSRGLGTALLSAAAQLGYMHGASSLLSSLIVPPKKEQD